MAALPQSKAAKSLAVPESVSAELDALHVRLVSLEKRIRAHGAESRSMAPAQRISLASRLRHLRTR